MPNLFPISSWPQKIKRGYYKYIFSRKIFTSKPFTCDINSDLELHFLAGEKFILHSMWCLKTFYYYSGLRPRLIIHDDGTLQEKSRRVFLEHFTNAQIIKRSDADQAMRGYLKNYPFCQKVRFDVDTSHFRNSVFSIRLLDFMFYSQSKKILSIDSDILFFQKPIELIERINKNQGFFMQDCKDSNILTRQQVLSLFNVELLPGINTGIFYFPHTKYCDMDLLEKYFKLIFETPPLYDRYTKDYVWLDQSIFAVIFSKNKDLFSGLDETHSIFLQPLTNKTVCHHFTSHTFHWFLLGGLIKLKEKRFLQELNA